ncbi:MAG: ribonuclease P protein component 4 [Candidatus Aenigmatarchaeota archaeon]
MKKAAWTKKIAKERIEILFNLAEKELKKHPERSRRYVELARKIGLRYNVRLKKELKRKFCKECNSFLIPGISSTIRIENGYVTVKCSNCKKIYRYLVKK